MQVTTDAKVTTDGPVRADGKLRTDGPVLVDGQGRQRVLRGINLVAKGRTGSTDPAHFRGSWSEQDLRSLREIGLDAVRLGVLWAAVEPTPGEYSAEHLHWIGGQLDLLHEAGFAVLLDGHQDLYSQSFGDGAPAWATLTDAPFTATELWSDAYLEQAAVHEAYDAFWADAPGPDGVGIRTRYARTWAMLAGRFGAHPAVIGYDVLNEPTPGAAAGEIFAAILGAFGTATGQDPAAVARDFADPEAKLAQLGHLDDPALHRRLGDTIAPLLESFEHGSVHALYTDVVRLVRAEDQTGLILREHDYFGNTGIPAPVPPLQDHAWAYSPHGYDLVVDTPAMALASDQRVTTIFERAAETADRLGVPVLVGEWGAFGSGTRITDHAQIQLDLFDREAWSWFYWCWEEGFASTEAAQQLRRPRPVAVAGRDLRCGRSAGGSWKAAWTGTPGTAPSEFWIPPELDVEVMVGNRRVPALRDGARVLIEAAEGEHRLRVS